MKDPEKWLVDDYHLAMVQAALKASETHDTLDMAEAQGATKRFVHAIQSDALRDGVERGRVEQIVRRTRDTIIDEICGVLYQWCERPADWAGREKVRELKTRPYREIVAENMKPNGDHESVFAGPFLRI